MDYTQILSVLEGRFPDIVHMLRTELHPIQEKPLQSILVQLAESIQHYDSFEVLPTLESAGLNLYPFLTAALEAMELDFDTREVDDLVFLFLGTSTGLRSMMKMTPHLPLKVRRGVFGEILEQVYLDVENVRPPLNELTLIAWLAKHFEDTDTVIKTYALRTYMYLLMYWSDNQGRDPSTRSKVFDDSYFDKILPLLDIPPAQYDDATHFAVNAFGIIVHERPDLLTQTHCDKLVPLMGEMMASEPPPAFEIYHRLIQQHSPYITASGLHEILQPYRKYLHSWLLEGEKLNQFFQTILNHYSQLLSKDDRRYLELRLRK